MHLITGRLLGYDVPARCEHPRCRTDSPGVGYSGVEPARHLAGALKRRFLSVALVIALAVAVAGVRGAHATFSGTLTGTLPSGATYLIEVPPVWNGTLALFSHRYRPTFVSNPALDSPNLLDPLDFVSDPVTHDWLLDHGYALAGSSFSTAGWAVQEAFDDQIALLDLFASQVAPPARTIAWGQSLGGMISAGLVQLHPERFAGALPMCGVLAGGVATMNAFLDAAFVFKTLIDPSLQIANYNSSAFGSFAQAQSALSSAQATPDGRARIALSLAMVDIPGWFDPTGPEPPRNDYAAQEVAQFQWAQSISLFLFTVLRAELEARAGGNPSWNTGVDYGAQLRKSVNRREVVALYKAAGLSLDQDLATLAAAPRIAADPSAVDYLNTYITLDGNLHGVPVLTMHLIGDGNVVVVSERAYKDAVTAAGDRKLLRQVYVDRPGHCSFTPPETIAAFQALVRRIDTGSWGNVRPRGLNQDAAALGLGPSDFARFKPKTFPRPLPE